MQSPWFYGGDTEKASSFRHVIGAQLELSAVFSKAAILYAFYSCPWKNLLISAKTESGISNRCKHVALSPCRRVRLSTMCLNVTLYSLFGPVRECSQMGFCFCRRIDWK